jgi:hypothetical protein
MLVSFVILFELFFVVLCILVRLDVDLGQVGQKYRIKSRNEYSAVGSVSQEHKEIILRLEV